MRKLQRWMLVVPLCLVMTGLASAKDLDSSIGQKIDSFTLSDFYGKEHSLADYKNKQAIVVYFMGVECPLAKLYAPRMERIAKELAEQGVAVLGVNSNRQDSITEISGFAQRHKVTFPILKDAGNKLADQFGAQRTPQVFVLDKDRMIRYQGRVDGTYTFGSGVGYSSPTEKRADLVEAVNELLAGKDVSVPATEAKGCIIGRVREVNTASDVTYSNQMARLFNDRCVKCHREDQIAPFAMTNYEEVAGWGEMIAEVIREQRMPPWHANPKHGDFSNEVRLTQDEKEMVYAWVEAGCPEGDPADLPEPPTFAGGWTIPQEPDMVLYIADEPVDVMAEGVEPYRYYQVDPGFTEDTWVKMAECMPGNPGVVHHIIASIGPPKTSAEQRRELRRARRRAREAAATDNNKDKSGSDDDGDRRRRGDRDLGGLGFLAGFAPGSPPLVLDGGYAKKIPAGSTIIFQMHYTPNGSPQTDRSAIGLTFMDEKDVTHVLATTSVGENDFVIPAGEPNHKVTGRRTLSRDTTMVSMFPHTHVRGKAFRYEAFYPDGTKEVLLDVPFYDFNWQNYYIFREPKVLPKGTELVTTAWYDNSEDNLHNPDPTVDVTWGDQTWEEMMIGFYDISFPIEELEGLLKENEELIKKQEAEAKAKADSSGD